MNRFIITSIAMMMAVACMAVPAYPGWRTVTQADGTTIEIKLIGDEFYHYTVNRAGQEIKLNASGNYEVVGEAPSAAKIQARRAKSPRMQVRKARKEFGVTPNLAPRGIVLMVTFADQSFKASTTRDVIDSLCNAMDCKVNKNGSTAYPSAGQYFADQSNGAYRPQFDVYGPYNLSKETAYYGENDLTEDANDIRPVNMLVEACKLADKAGVDFTRYDSDNDGLIDFVYVIYAGKGEASGGAEETIWPHSWSVSEQLAFEEYYSLYPEEYKQEYKVDFVPYFTNEYSESDCYVDGKVINTYACSNELSGSSLDGIGTLCHEFGHVMGLPDFYDTNYGTNYKDCLTPGPWDIMEMGSYNENGHCPPNYSPWEKYFFGWHTPINLGSAGTQLSLTANGQTGYQAYQITAGDDQVGPTDSLKNDAACYYIENRQQNGWDYGLPAAGMLIWKVQYSRVAWKDNAPNNETNKPRYTLVIPSGTEISSSTGTKNVWPYSSKTSWSGVSGKPLKDITKSGNLITLTYIEVPTIRVVTWVVNGETLETREYAKDGSEDLVLPTKEVVPCEGTTFIGWTAVKEWADPFGVPSDLFTEAAGKVTSNITYYAVFE